MKIKDVYPILKILGVMASLFGFLFATFATVSYVDAKSESSMGVLTDIRDRVIRIENRMFDLSKRRK